MVPGRVSDIGSRDGRVARAPSGASGESADWQETSDRQRLRDAATSPSHARGCVRMTPGGSTAEVTRDSSGSSMLGGPGSFMDWPRSRQRATASVRVRTPSFPHLRCRPTYSGEVNNALRTRRFSSQRACARSSCGCASRLCKGPQQRLKSGVEAVVVVFAMLLGVPGE